MGLLLYLQARQLAGCIVDNYKITALEVLKAQAGSAGHVLQDFRAALKAELPFRHQSGERGSDIIAMPHEFEKVDFCFNL